MTAISYTVRESTRAKVARLTLSLEKGLVVVVPCGFDQRQIPAMVEEKRAWIERARRTLQTRADQCPAPDRSVPARVHLAALGRQWRVELRSTKSARTTARACDGVLTVSGAVRDREACLGALHRWLARMAREHLGALLLDLAREKRVTVGQIRVGHMRTRWASRSAKGTVSLNAALLFLDPVLVRHVLLHELAHVKHMNHSKRFWAVLAKWDPDCAVNDKALNPAWRIVPGWARPG